jgi:FkbM family methyltransferase
MSHHPIFAEFPPFEGVVPAGYIEDYIGTITRGEYNTWRVYETETRVTAELPPIEEEYFEWVDLLEAVAEARDSFTMYELGAGWGRWSARALTAAARRGLRRSAVLVEADPIHAEWARQHLADNGHDVTVMEAAVGPRDGVGFIVVRYGSGDAVPTPREWYGQYLLPPKRPGRIDGEYAGRPVVMLRPERGAIEVPLISLATLLATQTRVDLMDMDVQGSEGDAVAAGIDALTRCVRRLHVGTHSRENEARVRNALGAAGWQCLRDCPGQQVCDTPYGRIRFDDGVQTWVNPNL